MLGSKCFDALWIAEKYGGNCLKCHKACGGLDHTDIFSLGENDAFWVIAELFD
jgi:hypothetical protein